MPRKLFMSCDIGRDEQLADIGKIDPMAPGYWQSFLLALDDWGRGSASAKLLKMSMFPGYDFITEQVIEGWLDLYAQHGLIMLYTANGKRYMAVDAAKWFDYQSHIRAEKRVNDRSKCPPPPMGCMSDEPSFATTHDNARNPAQIRASVAVAEFGNGNGNGSGNDARETRSFVPDAAADGPDAKAAADELVSLGLAAGQAGALVSRYGLERVRRQIRWLPFRAPKKPAAMLASAIEQDYEEPPEAAAEREEAEQRTRQIEKEQEHRRARDQAALAAQEQRQAEDALLAGLAEHDRQHLEARARDAMMQTPNGRKSLVDRPGADGTLSTLRRTMLKLLEEERC